MIFIGPFDHGGDIYGKRIDLDFSVNTNPLGMPEEVKAALISRVGEFSCYPDPRCRELTAAIAKAEKLPESWILCGNGAADLIYRLCYAVKPRRASVKSPTFSEYERALTQAGGEIAYTPEPDSDMVFICHPNNPTGLLEPESAVPQALETGAVVVVDECFLDFTEGKSNKPLLGDNPRLVILKAFTKLYAMAGLRLGYIICSDAALLEAVRAAAQVWSVSVPAQIAGAAALGCAGWGERTRELVKTERVFLTKALTNLGLRVFPSDANFLLIQSEKPLYELLLKKGVLIRSCANFRGLDGTYYRLGLKTRLENKILVNALGEALWQR